MVLIQNSSLATRVECEICQCDDPQIEQINYLILWLEVFTAEVDISDNSRFAKFQVGRSCGLDFAANFGKKGPVI